MMGYSNAVRDQYNRAYLEAMSRQACAYHKWAMASTALWAQREGRCEYCGSAEERMNLRGGRECSGCGAPK